MKEVSKKGVRTLDPDEVDLYMDPPGQKGLTQRLFNAIDHEPIPIPRGVYRFKSHQEMNRQWDEAMDEIVRRKRERRSSEKGFEALVLSAADKNEKSAKVSLKGYPA